MVRGEAGNFDDRGPGHPAFMPSIAFYLFCSPPEKDRIIVLFFMKLHCRLLLPEAQGHKDCIVFLQKKNYISKKFSLEISLKKSQSKFNFTLPLIVIILYS